jgi:hypothetical protein
MQVDPQAGRAIAALIQQADQTKAAALTRAAAGGPGPQDLLFTALGARLEAHDQDPAKTLSFSADITAGVSDTLNNLGKRYFKLVEKALHELICGSDGGDVRQKIADAGLNWGVIGTVLSGAIASVLGVAPAIATALAAIVIYLFIKPAGKLACETWHPA